MSRASVVGVLIAVEVLIAGIALYVIGGSGSWSGMNSHGGFFSGIHHYSFVAAPVAPLDAGTSPSISIDDPDSRVEVGASSDGLVHVKDLTGVHGPTFSSDRSIPQLHVTRTADGVSIVRPPHAHFFVFGEVDERIEVDVPPGSKLDVARCSGADVSNLAGPVVVRSQDGHITLTALRGTVDARSDDGYIEASDLRGDSLTMESSDGHLALRDVAVAALTARTNDGHIDASGIALTGTNGTATLHSDDGSIKLSLAPGNNLTVAASSNDGSVAIDGKRVDSGDSDSAQHTVRVGDGSGSLTVSTNDGSIHIITNGA